MRATLVSPNGAEGAALLDRSLIIGEGAAAVVVEKSASPCVAVTPSMSFSPRTSRFEAARLVRAEFDGTKIGEAVLFDSQCGSRHDALLERYPRRAGA
jgi:hypothetical protein